MCTLTLPLEKTVHWSLFLCFKLKLFLCCLNMDWLSLDYMTANLHKVMCCSTFPCAIAAVLCPLPGIARCREQLRPFLSVVWKASTSHRAPSSGLSVFTWPASHSVSCWFSQLKIKSHCPHLVNHNICFQLRTTTTKLYNIKSAFMHHVNNWVILFGCQRVTAATLPVGVVGYPPPARTVALLAFVT